MSRRPNESWRGSSSYMSTLAITAALFAIPALTASLLSKEAMSGTRASSTQPARTTRSAVEGNMPPLDGATAWINLQPLKAADLRGKVVLIESVPRSQDMHGVAREYSDALSREVTYSDIPPRGLGTGAEKGGVAGAPDAASGDDGRAEPGGSV